tara:strand:+ start:102 stop:596 length:495 start_codon:yes stop_codon:yes gene_type:complete
MNDSHNPSNRKQSMKYDDLKPKQKQYIIDTYHQMVDIENIDPKDGVFIDQSIKRNYLDYISVTKTAPAWIVHDKTRRDPDKWGHYFIPELWEYALVCEFSKEAGEPIPIDIDNLSTGEKVLRNTFLVRLNNTSARWTSSMFTYVAKPEKTRGAGLNILSGGTNI